MADRVHPGDVFLHSEPPPPPVAAVDPLKPPRIEDKPLLPQGTYVIQIPKDQIYRVPPPENSTKIKKLSARKPRRSCCCRCFCWTLATLFIFLILLAITGAVLYLVYRPEAPKYSIENISVSGINLTPSSSISPRLTVGIRAQNPNDKIAIYYYRKGSSVNVHYAGVNLCNGELPTFDQQPNNVTVFQTALRGSNIILARDVHSQLLKQETEGNVPLRLKVKAPVKIKIGAVKTWELTVTVKCDVAVDRLTQQSKIISKNCDYSVKLW